MRSILDIASDLSLGALALSTCLKALDKFVEHQGERHPASSFWPMMDRFLDRADAVFGWFGEFMCRFTFKRNHC